MKEKGNWKMNNFPHLLFLAIIGNIAQLTYGKGLKNLSHICGSSSDQPWCIPEDYDFKNDPVNHKNESNILLPWDYFYELWLMEISGIDDRKQGISFLMYFTTEWHDPRIQIDENSEAWIK